MAARYPSWEPEYQRAYRERTWTPEKLEKRRIYARRRAETKREHITATRKAFFAAHPEKYEAKKAKQREWYAANKKRHLDKAKQYRAVNREKIKAAKQAYYLRNLEHFSEKSRNRYRANPEHWIKKMAEWTAANRDRVNAYRRNRYKTDPQYRQGRTHSILKWQKKDRESGRHRIRQREKRARERALVSDKYARMLLAKRSALLGAKDFPQPLVELKKAEICLKRQIQQTIHER